MEIWKDVQGFEGYYQVSNQGRIKSLSRKVKCGVSNFYMTREIILSPSLDKKGYYRVNLSKNSQRKTCLVHVLVASAFIPNPESKPQVNHKNGIKTDNTENNLEWATNQENIQHAYNNGLHPNGKRVLCVDTGKIYMTASEAGRDIGLLDPTPVQLVCRGKRRRTKGLRFKYIEE